jgi:hypothetical protein
MNLPLSTERPRIEWVSSSYGNCLHAVINPEGCDAVCGREFAYLRSDYDPSPEPWRHKCKPCKERAEEHHEKALEEWANPELPFGVDSAQ